MKKSHLNFVITNKDFFVKAGRWKDCKSQQTVTEWWDAFLEVIIRDVFLLGSCKIPGIGTISTKYIEGGFQKQIGPDGKEVIYTVPARMMPYFIPEDDFINDINCVGVTKKYRKRLKEGALTEHDYEREARANAMDNVSAMYEDRTEQAQEEFQKTLKQKRIDNKRKKLNDEKDE